MIRRLVKAVTAISLMGVLVSPAFAEDDQLTVRIQDTEGESIELFGGQASMNLLGPTLNLEMLNGAAFAEAGLDVRVEWTFSQSIGDSTEFEAPDILILPRKASKIIYDSRPFPTKIATLERRTVRANSEETIDIDQRNKEQLACNELTAEFEIWTYMDDETLDSDVRVQKLLIALGAIVGRTNLAKDRYKKLYMETWYWDFRNQDRGFDWFFDKFHEPYKSNKYFWGHDVFANINLGAMDDYHERPGVQKFWRQFYPDEMLDIFEVPGVNPVCTETWSLYSISRAGWNIDIASTLTVRLDPSHYADKRASHYPMLDRIEHATWSGAFAARGLVVDIQYGIYGVDRDVQAVLKALSSPDDQERQDDDAARADIVIEHRDWSWGWHSSGLRTCAVEEDYLNLSTLESEPYPPALADFMENYYSVCVAEDAVDDPRVEAFFDALSSPTALMVFGMSSWLESPLLGGKSPLESWLGIDSIAKKVF